MVTSGFALGLAGAAVALALSDQELRAEKKNPHRLYAPSAVPPVSMMLAPVPVIDGHRVSLGLAASLSGRF